MRKKTRLLSGYADYTVWNESQRISIIIEAKRINSTDTCLGQLTSYMGVVHTSRKDEQKQSPIVYGGASGGLPFRFYHIDDEGNQSQSRLLEREMGDKSRIYSVSRSLINIANPGLVPLIDKFWSVLNQHLEYRRETSCGFHIHISPVT